MRVAVTLTATDLNDGSKKILADGPAILKDRVLLYREAQTGARHRISFQDDLIIERNAEVNSRTVLKRTGHGEAVVDSPYGIMKMRTECMVCNYEEDVWEAEYAVYSGNEQVLHQRLKWEIRQLC